MNAKMFEVRDRATFIPVLAVQLNPESEADRYLLARAGYGLTAHEQGQYVILCQVNAGSGRATCDPYDWTGSRTMMIAHDYVLKNFSELPSGAVVDVEFILGETQSPKQSEASES